MKIEKELLDIIGFTGGNGSYCSYNVEPALRDEVADLLGISARYSPAHTLVLTANPKKGRYSVEFGGSKEAVAANRMSRAVSRIAVARLLRLAGADTCAIGPHADTARVESGVEYAAKLSELR